MKKTLFTAIALAMLVMSCKKEGCTDRDATNFDDKAKKNDNTCEFEASWIFFYDKTTAQKLQLGGSTTVYVYVDDKLIGNQATNTWYNSIPSCESESVMKVTKKLGGSKSKAYTYSIKDQDGYEYVSGVLNFDANLCQKFQFKVE